MQSSRARADHLWEDYFRKPSHWLDNRKSKVSLCVYFLSFFIHPFPYLVSLIKTIVYFTCSKISQLMTTCIRIPLGFSMFNLVVNWSDNLRGSFNLTSNSSNLLNFRTKQVILFSVLNKKVKRLITLFLSVICTIRWTGSFFPL